MTFYAVLAPAVVMLWLLIVKRWRRGIYGLVLYLPFAGLPTIFLYPAPAITRLLKDILFVLPAYAGFLFWLSSRASSRAVPFRTAPVILLGIYSFVVLAQFFNPQLDSAAVGLVGIRSRLLYVPCLFLGYYFVDSTSRLFGLARLMLFVGCIPAFVGLAQAVLLYAGHQELAYGWYGDAAAAVTQNFVQLPITATVRLMRIPSTFTFPTQYSSHLLALLPIAYALSVTGLDGDGRRRRLAAALLVVIAAAAVTSGARSMFILVPALLILTAALVGKRRKLRRIVKGAVLGAAGLLLLAWFFGLSPRDLLTYLDWVTNIYLGSEANFSIQSEFTRALHETWTGHGVGTSTGPARFLGDNLTPAFEGYYAVTVAELGLAGLIALLVLWVGLLLRGTQAFLSVRRTPLRPFAGALLVLSGVVMIYLFKGSLLDYDPLNVYFWLYTGILLKLPAIAARPTDAVASGGPSG